jgi:hypothetical protein
MERTASPNSPTFRVTAKRYLVRQLRIALGLGLLAVVAINYGVRLSGGSVSLWSVSRLGERLGALRQVAVHRVTCRCDDATVSERVRAAALRHHLSYRLALSVAKTESGLVHTRISSTGAMGVMQLMPITARELGVSEPFDIDQNVDGGVRYLKHLLGLYRGNMRRAVAAYNAGPARIPRRGPLSMPTTTRSYVAKILAGM